MWAALALAMVADLAPAQAGGDLELKNVRITYGLLGQERPNTKVALPKFLPGDVVVVSFDIDGLQSKDGGLLQYSMGMELIRKGKAGAKDRVEFSHDPQPLQLFNPLGGTRLPSYALSVIGPDTVPGEFTLKVTIKDRVANKTQSLAQNFEVIPAKFGFVSVGLHYETLQPAPPLGVPGQTFQTKFSLVGFKLDKKGQPDVAIAVRVLDDTGRPTGSKAVEGHITKLADPKQPLIIHFDPIPLMLNRIGRFKIEMKATDNHTGQTTEQSLDLNIIDPNRIR